MHVARSGPSDDARSSSRPDDAPAVVATASTATDQILRQAHQAFACDAASILSYSPSGRVELLLSSDATARRADQLQLGLEEGSAVSARDQDEVALSGNVRADQRWPRWGPAVAGMGWQSVLSARLTALGRDLGVLTLYASRAAAFDATHAYAARVFAEHAVTALVHAEESEHLREAMASRHRISLAQGIVMEQHGFGADEAFELLRRTSEERGAKLQMVADEVVSTGSLDGDLGPRGAG